MRKIKVNKYIKSICVIAMAMLSAGTAIAETITPGDFNKSVRIRFDGYTGSSTLTNFPVLIELTDGLNGFYYNDLESDDYSDLRFTKDDGVTSIPFEVEQWNATLPPAADPAAISGCLLWLKADAGAQTNAVGGVTNWVDQSGSGNDAASQAATDHPVFVPNTINGEPVVRFSGADDNYIKFPKLTTIRTVFWVIKEDADATYSPNPRFLLGDQGGNTYDFHRGVNKEIWSSAHAPLMFNGTTELNGSEIDGRTTPAPTGMSVLSVRTAGNATANSLSRDRAINGRSWDGDIAEVILYNRVLTKTEVESVYIYLENKYGISIALDRTSKVWVQAPLLTNSASIFAYWGNSAATDLPVYSTNGSTWAEGFGGVWHMNAVNPLDATTNSNNGAANNTPDLISGQVAEGIVTTASEQDYISVNNAASINPDDNFTVSIWFKSGLAGTWFRNLVGNYGADGGGGNFWGLGWMNANNLGFVARTGGVETRLYGGALNDSTWHHLTGQKDGETIRLFVDGSLVSSGTRAGSPANSEQLRFCNHGTTYVDSTVDEARISTVVRSADWIKASYDTQAAPASFATYELDYYYDTSTDADLQAGNGTWDSTANSWSRATSGSDPLNPWENGASAIFEADGTSVITVDSVSALKLVFNGTGYQLTGGTIDLDRNGIEANESAVIASSITMADAQEWTTAAGRTLTVSGTTANNGNALSVNGEGDTTISGIISGNGALTKNGTGTTLIDAYETYTGGTVVSDGTLQLNKGGVTGAIRGTLTVEESAQVDLLVNNALGYGGNRISILNIKNGLVNNTGAGDNGWNIAINMTGGELQSNGGTSSATASSYFSLGGGSAVNTLPSPDTAVISGRVVIREGNTDNRLPFNVADGPADVDLQVNAALTPQNGAGITKSGPGVMSLTAAGTYTGTTRIDNGTLLVNNGTGSGTGSSAVTINGGTLGGTGTVSSAVSVSSNGGFVSPGNSTGTLTVEGGLNLSSSGTAGIYVELNGAADYDAVAVTGAVTLGSCLLAGEATGAVTPSDKYFIIVNDGADAINGTFSGIPEGGTVEIGDLTFTVSYQGDSLTQATSGGNDVVLYNSTATPPPSAPYWKEISFGGYTRPTTLVNFPAMVPLQESMDDFSYTTFISPNGNDLRFYSDRNKTVELNYEIEVWNTSGISYIWVQVPALSKDTSIWAYWGDTNEQDIPAYTTDGSTWSAEYAGVWHLNDAANVIADSTAAARNGTNNGTVSTAGRIGQARNWPGANSITLQAASLASLTNQVTVSFWQWGLNLASRTIFGANNSSGGRILQSHLPWSNGNIYWDAGSSYDRIYKGAALSLYTGEWSHWSFTKNNNDGTMRIYRNGEQWHSGGGLYKSLTGAASFRLGSNAGGAENYRGSIDEFRVSNIERSPDWIWACYINQNEPLTFTAPRGASYWDTSSAAGLQSGSGTWDNAATANWSDNDLLGSTPINEWNNGPSDAYLTADGGGTITVASGVEAAALYIEKPGYTLTGGSLTLSAGILAAESATIQTPITLSAPQVWYVETGKTLTIDGPGWNIQKTLVKQGGGKLLFINQKYSYAATDLDIIVEEGEVEFGSYYWGSTRTTDPMRIHVLQDATFSTPQLTPFGAQNSSDQSSLAQIIFEENSVWNIGGYTSIQNGSYGSEGRIVLRGATTQGGRFIPQAGTAIETRASAITSVINTEWNGYGTGDWTLIVAEGGADPDVRINGAINGNVTSITKTGTGTAELSRSAGNAYHGTTITAGKLLVSNSSGSATGDGAVTINGGTLAGTGIISGAVSFGANGGVIAPGNATGTLTVNNAVNLSSIGESSLDVTIDGGDAGEYSSLAVNGAVTISNATLNVTMNTAISGSKKLFIIKNDGTDEVLGIFDGIPEGSSIDAGDTTFKIYYSADADSGDITGGNDVLLVSNLEGTVIIVK